MEELDGITTSTLDITTGATLSTSSNGSYYALDGTSSINSISYGSISTTGYSGNTSWDQTLVSTNEQTLDLLIQSISNLDDAINLLRVQVSSLSKEIKKEKFDKRTLKTKE